MKMSDGKIGYKLAIMFIIFDDKRFKPSNYWKLETYSTIQLKMF